MLDSSQTLLGVHLLLIRQFKQTQCYRYFHEIIFGSFGNGQVKKNTLCMSYFNRFIEGSLYNESMNKIRHYVLSNSLSLF